MSLSLSQTTQFQINELAIVTKGGKLDIQNLFDELNIFDSILQPCISGNILITDAIGLSSKLLLDGSEFIVMDIGKDSDDLRIRKSFRIYKQSNRKNINQTSEMYLLHFVSDEYVFSQQQLINSGFQGTYFEIAVKILTEKLKAPYESWIKGVFTKSHGIKYFVVPNLRPIEAIQWMAKRAVNENMIPDFLFFQNKSGYNFVSVSSLLDWPEIFQVNFDPKNVEDSTANELTGARDIRVISQYDLIDYTNSGVAAGQFIGYDPITKNFSTKNMSFLDVQGKMKNSNETPNLLYFKNRNDVDNFEAYDSRKSVYNFTEAQKYSSYIKTKDPKSITTLDDTHNYVFQRKTIFSNLFQQRVRITLPGNFAVSSGYNLFLKIPSRSIHDDGGYCEGGDNFDRTLYGKYLIVGTRHIIRYDKHETIIEVCKNSNSKSYAAVDNTEFRDAALNYGGAVA